MSRIIAHFVSEFPSFRYHGNKDQALVNLNDTSMCSKGHLLFVSSKHFCCRMYALTTVHFITDRQTDRQTDRETTVSWQ